MMKKIVLMFGLFGLLVSGCKLIDLDIPEKVVPKEPEKESVLILKSGYGFNSAYGNIYVPKGIGVILKLEGKTAENEIKTASWTIEGVSYEGSQIIHKFNSLGEVRLKVKVEFKNNSKEEREFTVVSVLDIGTVDPVQVFVEKNPSKGWDVLFLFSKERLRFATSKDYYFNGLVTNWQKKGVPEDNAYIINAAGKPEATKDVGKYVGVKINIQDRGLYNIALINSGENWTDFSGSRFIRTDNPGLVWFWFEEGTVVPQGNVLIGDLPGVNGDNYFRFTIHEDSKTVTLFFKLDKDFTTSAFVLRQETDKGKWLDPINMTSVTNQTSWGKIEVPMENNYGKIMGLRYGPDISKPAEFSSNMEKSNFYDDFFKNIRIVIYKI